MKDARIRQKLFNDLASPDELLQLFDCMPGLSFFVKDRRGRFVALNRRGCEYCGVESEQDAIGMTDHDFFPRERADEYLAGDMAVMETGEAIVNRLESAPEAEGSPRMVVTNKVPLRNKQGRVIGVAGFSRQVEQLRETATTVDSFIAAVEQMHQRYGEKLATDELAALAGLSTSQFERRFRQAMGVTPHQYLMRVRVEQASQLLIETDHSITQIAHQCGFYDHAHFSRTFKRQLHCSPSEYRSRSVPTR